MKKEWGIYLKKLLNSLVILMQTSLQICLSFYIPQFLCLHGRLQYKKYQKTYSGNKNPNKLFIGEESFLVYKVSKKLEKK